MMELERTFTIINLSVLIFLGGGAGGRWWSFLTTFFGKHMCSPSSQKPHMDTIWSSSCKGLKFRNPRSRTIIGHLLVPHFTNQKWKSRKVQGCICPRSHSLVLAELVGKQPIIADLCWEACLMVPERLSLALYNHSCCCLGQYNEC